MNSSEKQNPINSIDGENLKIQENPVNFIVPKLESTSSSSSSNEPVRYSESQGFVKLENLGESDAVTPEHLPSFTHCPICNQTKPSQFFRKLKFEEEKMIVMIGCVLRNEYTSEDAKQFMNNSNPRDNDVICHSHFADSIDSIVKSLKIENLDKLTSGSLNNNMKHMVKLANFIWRKIQTRELRNVLQKCIKENVHLVRIPFGGSRTLIRKRKKPTVEKVAELNIPRLFSRNSRPLPDIHSRTCGVCSEIKMRYNLKEVTAEKERLILLVGCILRNEKTREEAKTLMSVLSPMTICSFHFFTSIDEILKALGVENLEEIFTIPRHMMTKLMMIVNFLCPKYGHLQFFNVFHNLVVKNKFQEVQEAKNGQNHQSSNSDPEPNSEI